MKYLLRTFGVAVLAAALLDASAGLCFCHSGPVVPGSAPAAGGCCHEHAATGRTALKAAGYCCHVESAESAATPAAPIRFASPAAVVTAVVSERAAVELLPCVARVLPGSPPPLSVLRV